MTTFCPAPLNMSDTIKSSMVFKAISLVSAITTPLPAAKPSALITIGYSQLSKYAFASLQSVKVPYSAVLTPYFFIKSLEKLLLPSSCAPFLSGPKHFRPASLNLSVIPLVNGSSGPTTVNAISLFLAKTTNSSISVIFIFSHLFSMAVPPLPGATNILETLLLLAIFQANACSLPPEPTNKTFIILLHH